MDSMDEDMVWLLLEIRVSLQAVNYSCPVIARRSQRDVAIHARHEFPKIPRQLAGPYSGLPRACSARNDWIGWVRRAG
jgi:hypothetical protein